MKNLKTVVAITFLALATSQVSMAAPSNNIVHFKAPATAGNGCPSNSTSHAITPDGTTLSILFDKYIAEPGNKSCNIAIPVHVPNGFQVSTLKADFRGFVEGRAELLFI
jgi:type 1 fimbria pilin